MPIRGGEKTVAFTERAVLPPIGAAASGKSGRFGDRPVAAWTVGREGRWQPGRGWR